MKISKLPALLTLFAALFLSLQTSLPQLAADLQWSETRLTMVSGIAMFMASILTLAKQYVSALIDNIATRAMKLVLVVEALGLINELFDVIPMSTTTGYVLRLIITILVMAINTLSSTLWPSPDRKRIA